VLVCLSVAANLSFVAYFKYANFFLASARALLRQLGLPSEDQALAIVLPLGISFYTFEAISYVVEVYRGRVRAVRNPMDYALYILFFPHLIAGPIVRPRDFLPQLGRPKRWDWDRMQLGVQFFLVGLFKKAVLADHLATVADPVFASPGAWGRARSGWACCPTPARSTATSRATRTWRWAWRTCSGSSCRPTSAGRTSRSA
jgi:alginate O-acetyltransferase complex protein AlgI